VSSDSECKEVDAFSEMKEDEECMLTEFDCCNSENHSNVAGADTLSETKEDCDNKGENTEEVRSMHNVFEDNLLYVTVRTN